MELKKKEPLRLNEHLGIVLAFINMFVLCQPGLVQVARHRASGAASACLHETSIQLVTPELHKYIDATPFQLPFFQTRR